METDFKVIKSILKKIDPNLYLHVEKMTKEVDCFLSPTSRWLVTLYSSPFPSRIFFHFMDLILCFGNWSTIIIAAVLIRDNRDSFLRASYLDDTSQVFDNLCFHYVQDHLILKNIYEMCLMIYP